MKRVLDCEDMQAIAGACIRVYIIIPDRMGTRVRAVGSPESPDPNNPEPHIITHTIKSGKTVCRDVMKEHFGIETDQEYEEVRRSLYYHTSMSSGIVSLIVVVPMNFVVFHGFGGYPTTRRMPEFVSKHFRNRKLRLVAATSVIAISTILAAKWGTGAVQKRGAARQKTKDALVLQKQRDADAAKALQIKADSDAAEALQADATRLDAEVEAERLAEVVRLAESVEQDDQRAKEQAEQRAEAERLAAEQATAERLAREQTETERSASAERLAESERLAEQRAEAEAERLVNEQADMKAERLAREQAEAEQRVEAERLAETERLAAEQAHETERLAHAERLAREQAQADTARLAQAEAERLAQAETERLAREQTEADESEHKEKDSARMGVGNSWDLTFLEEKEDRYKFSGFDIHPGGAHSGFTHPVYTNVPPKIKLQIQDPPNQGIYHREGWAFEKWEGGPQQTFTREVVENPKRVSNRDSASLSKPTVQTLRVVCWTKGMSAKTSEFSVDVDEHWRYLVEIPSPENSRIQFSWSRENTDKIHAVMYNRESGEPVAVEGDTKSPWIETNNIQPLRLMIAESRENWTTLFQTEVIFYEAGSAKPDPPKNQGWFWWFGGNK
jgi:hypothetical protein